MNNEISNERLEDIMNGVQHNNLATIPARNTEIRQMAKELLVLRNARDGWQLVPVEPTDGMINAALATGAYSIRTAYSAMLAAAPEVSNE